MRPQQDRTRFLQVADELARRFGEQAQRRMRENLMNIVDHGAGGLANPTPYESAIEELFAAGLKYCIWADAAARLTAPQFPIILDKGNFEQIQREPCERWSTRVWAQTQIGPYRADFLIRNWMLPAVGNVLAVVECDGHDFHEKTKEQAARDKERDNHFQSLNIAVLRYSGSTIWADPVKAAADALGKVELISLRRAAAVGEIEDWRDLPLLTSRWEGDDRS